MKLNPLKLVLLLIAFVSPVEADPIGTAFTYQGQLAVNGAPANDNYDFIFALYNSSSSGSELGSALITNGLPVSNGLFYTTLDFGNQFSGTASWLSISVRTNNTGNYVVLTPRQTLTPTPNALFATTASNLSGAVSVVQLTGALVNNQLANSAVTIAAGIGLSGGGAVALGGSTTLNNAGVLSVTGDANITANTVAGAVTLTDNSTSASSGNTIVSRDTSASFSANNITLYGALAFPDGASITSGENSFLYSGNNDLFVGLYSGGTTTAAANLAIGPYALNLNRVGTGNAAVGGSALQNCTNGNNNIALGSGAGSSLSTGNYNIDIGSPGFAGDNGAIRIGYGIYQTSAYMNGIYNTTVSGTAVQVNSGGQLGVASSSRIFKQDIQSMADTSDELLSLRPVTFKYKPEIEPQGLRQFGLIAEEVEQVDPNLVVHHKEHGIYTVRYEAVNAMLLNEFLKEHKTVEVQDAEIQDLKRIVVELKAIVEKLAVK
jgi:hypothetical protein